MSTPLPVSIVRPKPSVSDVVESLIGGALLALVRGLIIMALAPGVIDWHPTFWQSVVVSVLVSYIGRGSDYRLWTREAKR